MINTKSRKDMAGAKAFAAIILFIGLKRMGVEISDAELLSLAGTLAYVAGRIIDGIAAEDAAKLAAGKTPGPPTENVSDPLEDSLPPRNP